MIIVAKLPPLEHYKLTGETDSGLKIYSDRSCDRFQIAIPSNEWEKSWKIHIQESKNKSDKSVYLTRIRFKCLEMASEVTHKINREIYKGYIASAYQCDFHYCAPLGELIWLSYSISPSAK
jgi:hypothetical protein